MLKFNLHASAVILAAAAATACNGIFDGIYDDVTSVQAVSDGFSTNIDNPSRMTLTVDASDFMQWNYISLKNKTVDKRSIPLACEGDWDGRSGISFYEVNGSDFSPLSFSPTDPQSQPHEWDFAIHRFEVRTNGATVAELPCSSLDDLHNVKINELEFLPDSWSSTDVMVDISDMLAFRIGYQNNYVNTVLSRWVVMDISSPPPSYSASGRVYAIALADGSMAAVRLRSYVNALGVKGCLTIDIIYPWE